MRFRTSGSLIYDQVLPGSAALALFLLSAATLTYEINLTRLFSVAQFYHFAFMIVSIALLGFGASGTVLALFPHLQPVNVFTKLSWLTIACGCSMLAAHLLTNWLPFDSFSVAWDKRQVAVLVLHYSALACPFFFSGLVTGLLLTKYPQQAGYTYALNLLGSACGCVLALLIPNTLGGEGTVAFSTTIAGLTALLLGDGAKQKNPDMSEGLVKTKSKIRLYALIPNIIQVLILISLLAFTLTELGLYLTGRNGLGVMRLHLSPYKGFSYALQYPSAQLIQQEWNAFSRVDVVRSPGIRSLPGISYRFLDIPPPQDAVLVDGDDLSPILQEGAGMSFSAYMPSALAYQLNPNAETLILEPRGGLDILVALAEGAARVTAVEVNPLIIQAANHIYELPGVQVVQNSGRSYVRSSTKKYDVIVLSLTSTYHPVRSGAYSLAEEYRYTVESFQDALATLHPGGIMVITRWLQTPPSEFLRTFCIGITALENIGLDSQHMVVALRSYNSGTLYIKNSAFTPVEIQDIKAFAASRAFDLVYAPGLQSHEANVYNVLPEDSYYQSFSALISAQDRQQFYRDYPFDIRPSRDDHPFFGHYFKWSQSRQVLAEFGKTWQPFGGAGYFVIVALLGLTIILASGLVFLPALISRFRRLNPEQNRVTSTKQILVLVYFGFLGLAFLLVEIPLIQIFILYLDQPAFAVTTVLFSLLFFSGLGSRFSHRFSGDWAMLLLVAAVLSFPFITPRLFEETMGLSLVSRLSLSTLILAPIGFLMGIPFPTGISKLVKNKIEELIPWVWGVNGAASVISAVLAALLALTFGFGWVLRLGAACYAGAWFTARVWARVFPQIFHSQ